MKKALLRKLRVEAEKGELNVELPKFAKEVELPKPEFAKKVKIKKVSKKKVK